MLPVPEEPIPVVWQNTVVDVEATSRYGEPGTPDLATITSTMALRVPNAGRVSFIAPGHWEEDASAGAMRPGPADASTEMLARGDAAFADLLERFTGLRRRLEANQQLIDRMLSKVRRFHRFSLELDSGPGLVRFSARLPLVREDDADRETYKFSSIYPIEFAELAEGGDLSVIVLLPRSMPAQKDMPGYRVELLDATRDPAPEIFGTSDDRAPGQRIAVSWYWRADPILDVRYVYDRLV